MCRIVMFRYLIDTNFIFYENCAYFQTLFILFLTVDDTSPADQTKKSILSSLSSTNYLDKQITFFGHYL